PDDSDDAGRRGVGFRFSTVAGDVGWTPCARDESTQTTGTTIGTVVAYARYRLRIRIPSGGTSAFFSVNGAAEQQITTNLPSPSGGLGPTWRIYTQTAATRNLHVQRLRLAFGEEV